MNILLTAILLAASCLILCYGTVISDLKEKTEKYKNEIEDLYKLIAKECPFNHKYVKRTDEEVGVDHDVHEQLRNRLVKELFLCRQHIKIITASPTKPATSTSVRPTSTTTTRPTTVSTTTVSPIPKECKLALNYTNSWRRDYQGSNIRPGGTSDGSNCDLKRKAWFRFTGAAGNRMLNSCPKKYSCGTVFPYWTDEKMPSTVGVETTVKAYIVDEETTRGWLFGRSTTTTICKSSTRELRVMRCSDKPNDLIYKASMFANDCSEGFCGMV